MSGRCHDNLPVLDAAAHAELLSDEFQHGAKGNALKIHGDGGLHDLLTDVLTVHSDRVDVIGIGLPSGPGIVCWMYLSTSASGVGLGNFIGMAD